MLKKRILLSASLFHGANDACAVALPMVFPLLYNQKLLITQYSQIGILANLGLLTTLVFQIIVVNYAHRVEYRHILLFSLLGISLMLGLITTASSFLLLLGIYLLLRAFMSIYHPLGITMVSKTHPDQGLDFAMGIQSGSGNLGVFIAFISVGYLAQRFGWKMPLYVWGIVAFVFALLCYLIARKTALLHRDLQKPDIQLWTQTIRDLRRWIPGFIFGGACWGTTVYYAPSLLNHRFQVPLGKVGMYLALWIALGTIMPYLFGYLSRKIGRRKICLLGLGGATVFVFFLGIAPSRETAVLALLLYGSFLFLIYPSFQSFVGSQTPPRNQAVAFSLVANIQMLSGAVVNLFAGVISDQLGINYPFMFLAILGVITLGFYLKGDGPVFWEKTGPSPN
ncbi:MAG: MFS transporter [Candidatus Aminicenantes bacterium]|nr:MFS transporter [Candidatus Aminicenantes bacterium]